MIYPFFGFTILHVGIFPSNSCVSGDVVLSQGALLKKLFYFLWRWVTIPAMLVSKIGTRDSEISGQDVGLSNSIFV